MNEKEYENELSELEAQFCLLYVEGPAPYGGNAGKCFKAVFKEPSKNIVECTSADGCRDRENVYNANFEISARNLMKKEAVIKRIEELTDIHTINAATLRPRLTKMLLKISEECSESVYEDKFGTPLSPAALRSVAVSAMKELNDMYGIKEDIAHTVKLEGENGGGIVFNVIAPDKRDEPTFVDDNNG